MTKWAEKIFVSSKGSTSFLEGSRYFTPNCLVSNAVPRNRSKRELKIVQNETKPSHAKLQSAFFKVVHLWNITFVFKINLPNRRRWLKSLIWERMRNDFGFKKLRQSRRQRRLRQERHKFAYLTMKNNSFARFARGIFILYISLQFSFYRCLEITCFVVTWTKSAHDYDNFSISSCYLQITDTNLARNQSSFGLKLHIDKSN